VVRSPCFLIQSLDLYLRSNLKSCFQYLHSWQYFLGTNSQNHHLKETHHQTLRFQIDYFRNHFCYILRQFIFIALRQSKHLSSSQAYLRINLPSRLLFIHLGQSFNLDLQLFFHLMILIVFTHVGLFSPCFVNKLLCKNLIEFNVGTDHFANFICFCNFTCILRIINILLYFVNRQRPLPFNHSLFTFHFSYKLFSLFLQNSFIYFSLPFNLFSHSLQFFLKSINFFDINFIL